MRFLDSPPTPAYMPNCLPQRLGMDLKSLYIVQPDYGEQAFSIADELARSGAMDMIVVDSVSALVPRSEIEGDYGVPQVWQTVCHTQQQ